MKSSIILIVYIYEIRTVVIQLQAARRLYKMGISSVIERLETSDYMIINVTFLII